MSPKIKMKINLDMIVFFFKNSRKVKKLNQPVWFIDFMGAKLKHDQSPVIRNSSLEIDCSPFSNNY